MNLGKFDIIMYLFLGLKLPKTSLRHLHKPWFLNQDLLCVYAYPNMHSSPRDSYFKFPRRFNSWVFFSRKMHGWLSWIIYE